MWRVKVLDKIAKAGLIIFPPAEYKISDYSEDCLNFPDAYIA